MRPFISALLMLVAALPSILASDVAIFVRNLRQEGGQTLVPIVTPFPAYPAGLIPAAISGYASLRFRVQNGVVADVKVTAASQEAFGDVSKEAVAGWKFRSVGARPGSPKPVWMNCTFEFRVDDGDREAYLPTWAAGFAATRLSGTDVIRIATTLAKREGIDLAPQFRLEGADIALTHSGLHLEWFVNWGTRGFGKYYYVWINDETGKAESKTNLERKNPPGATPDQ